MDRKKILKFFGITGLAPALGIKIFRDDASHPDCDGPSIEDRLYQGPFPVEEVPGWNVVMTRVPSGRILDNFGMGLVTYVIDEAGLPLVDGESLSELIEKLANIPFRQKLYLRVNWKDLQDKAGDLNPSKAWHLAFEMAERYDKRIAFRIMLSNPEIRGMAIPDFVAEEVPKVKLGTADQIGMKGKVHYEPRYDHPVFQKAFREFNERVYRLD